MRRASLYTTGTQVSDILKKCQSMSQLKQTQTLLIKTNLISYSHLFTKLITLSSLSHFANLDHALSLFNSIPHSSSYLYTALIRAYSTSIFPIKSLHLYNQMCQLGIAASNLTFTSTLKACSRVPVVELEANTVAYFHKGSEIHCRILHVGFDSDSYVQNSLITVYSNCGVIDWARKVFDEMSDRTTVTWNTMAMAYSRHKDFDAADRILCQMPERDVTSWNCAITRRVRLGDIDGAEKIFNDMPERDSVSWNSMIAGHVSVRDYERSIGLFRRMLANGLKPTKFTLVSVLGACAETGSLEIGRDIHDHLNRSCITIEGFVGNALLDMYAKSGNVAQALKIFEVMGANKHVSCWNTMIGALAVHGHCDEALELFSKMDQNPNRVTFLGVLLAYSHKGSLEEGRDFFRKMVEVYKIKPDIKPYGCMVDMLCRRGLVDQAYKMVTSMPMKANSVIWKMILGACKVHGGVELAEVAFRELGAIGRLSDDDYVLMSNIYAGVERWGDVERLRCVMIAENISKQVTYSQVELN